MPELPEIETIARGLRTGIESDRIARVEIARDDYVIRRSRSAGYDLVGKTVESVTRHGKRLLLGLDPAGEIVVHLGMSGQVTLQPGDDPIAPHTHVRIGFARGRRELRIRDPRRFGGVWILDGDGGAGPGPLGPDALAIRLREFRGLLRRRRQIKALLLDQHAIAGIGNIYADEALHAAGIHPLARASDLSPEKARALHTALRRILRGAIRHGGSTFRDYRTTGGEPGGYQRRHRVYGREGEPCRRCAGTIERISAAGRSSHVCPGCQPG